MIEHIFKLCVHFVSVCPKVKKWIQTDTKVTFFLSICLSVGMSVRLSFFPSFVLFVCLSAKEKSIQLKRGSLKLSLIYMKRKLKNTMK